MKNNKGNLNLLIEKYKKIHSESIDGIFIAEMLFKDGASLAITIRVLDKLGYSSSKIDDIIEKTEWRNHKRSLEDLFFDFVELDDGLVEPDDTSSATSSK